MSFRPIPNLSSLQTPGSPEQREDLPSHHPGRALRALVGQNYETHKGMRDMSNTFDLHSFKRLTSLRSPASLLQKSCLKVGLVNLREISLEPSETCHQSKIVKMESAMRGTLEGLPQAVALSTIKQSSTNSKHF